MSNKFPSLFFLHSWTDQKIVFVSGSLIIAAFSLKAAVALVIQKKSVFYCQSLFMRLKARLVIAYQRAPYVYHLQKNSAHLISRVQDNTTGYINGVLLPVLNFTSNAFLVLVILLFLAVLHPILTIFLVTLFVMMGFLFDLFVKRKLVTMGKITTLANGEMIKNLNQGLKGLTETRVYGCENYFLDLFNRISQEYAYATGTLVVLQQIPRYLIENMIAIFIIGLCLGGIAIGLKTGSIVTIVGMFAAAGARLLPSITQLMATMNQIRGCHNHMNLLYNELVELDQSIVNVPAENLFLFREKLYFSHLHLKQIFYHYPMGTHSALENIEMNIIKGQSIGIIGPSGAGKSTLVNLILGFLEPEAGQLLVDGKPIANMRAWLNNFAYIPQHIFLLDDTLRKNIAFGVAEGEINSQKMEEVIKLAQLEEVVKELPDGLDTLLGENGVRLSGGQRQRVALARAFYHERDIIIMDEATSALDTETEKEVVNAIKRLKGSKTLIVIAHRLTTVEYCDVLYRIEKGRITSKGTFQQVVGVMS